MKSILNAASCVAILAFAVPAMAATDDSTTPHHHHHHMMHGKHGMMTKGATSGNAETEKLNEQSLQNAKAGVMPASGSDAATAPATPPAGGAMAAPGTGMSAAPGSGMMGTTAPGNAPPITTPPAAPASDNK